MIDRQYFEEKYPDIVRELRKVYDPEIPLDIFELFSKIYKDQDDLRESMIRNANTVVEKNIGATMRQLSLIRACL